MAYTKSQQRGLDALEEALRRAKALEGINPASTSTALSRRRALKPTIAAEALAVMDLEDPPAWATPSHLLAVLDIIVWDTATTPTLDKLDRLDPIEALLSYVMVGADAPLEQCDEALKSRLAYAAYQCARNWSHLSAYHSGLNDVINGFIKESVEMAALNILAQTSESLIDLISEQEYLELSRWLTHQSMAAMAHALDVTGVEEKDASLQQILDLGQGLSFLDFGNLTQAMGMKGDQAQGVEALMALLSSTLSSPEDMQAAMNRFEGISRDDLPDQLKDDLETLSTTSEQPSAPPQDGGKISREDALAQLRAFLLQSSGSSELEPSQEAALQRLFDGTVSSMKASRDKEA